MQFKLSKQSVVDVDGKGVLDELIEIGVYGGLAEPVRTKMYVLFHIGQAPKRFAPGVPIHELFGSTVCIITHRLTAHLALDVAMVSEFKIDVDGHGYR